MSGTGREDAERPVRSQQVSEKVALRLALAEQALRFVKAGIPHAGNQTEALEQTGGNAYLRMKVKRILAKNGGIAKWLPPGRVKSLAKRNPLTAEAAAIAMTQGGNCGEHAELAYHFLTAAPHGQPVHYVTLKNVDHAFVLIGDLKKDADHEIVVVDAWVLNPQPLLWSHFSYRARRKNIIKIKMRTPRRSKTRQSVLRRQIRLELHNAMRQPEQKMLERLSGLLEAQHSNPSNVRSQWNEPYASKIDWRYDIPDTARKQARKLLLAKPTRTSASLGPSAAHLPVMRGYRRSRRVRRVDARAGDKPTGKLDGLWRKARGSWRRLWGRKKSSR